MVRKLFGAIVMFLLAGAAALPLSGVAYAEEPVVDGECSATLLGDRGKPLHVDADALLGEGGLPAVRLGSSTERIAEKAAVDLPVGDVVEQLDVREVPVVGEAADAGCGAVDTAGGAVNKVAETTSTAVAANKPELPELPELPTPVEPVQPEEPQDEAPAGGGEVVDEVPSAETLALPDLPVFQLPAFGSVPAGPLPQIEVLPDAAAQGPDLRFGGRSDGFTATSAGQVQALPEVPADEPARAPFVLAVAMVAVVAAVMVRRWITRTGS